MYYKVKNILTQYEIKIANIYLTFKECVYHCIVLDF